MHIGLVHHGLGHDPSVFIFSRSMIFIRMRRRDLLRKCAPAVDEFMWRLSKEKEYQRKITPIEHVILLEKKTSW
jgi:hypothetical protein